MKTTCNVCGRIVAQEDGCPQHPKRSNTKQQKFRVQVLLRDMHRCRFCGSDGLVAAHWPVPLRALAEVERYDPRAGICVCQRCHKRIDVYA